MKSFKRCPYTAIDDATRARALKFYDRHDQTEAAKHGAYPWTTQRGDYGSWFS